LEEEEEIIANITDIYAYSTGLYLFNYVDNFEQIYAFTQLTIDGKEVSEWKPLALSMTKLGLEDDEYRVTGVLKKLTANDYDWTKVSERHFASATYRFITVEGGNAKTVDLEIPITEGGYRYPTPRFNCFDNVVSWVMLSEPLLNNEIATRKPRRGFDGCLYRNGILFAQPHPMPRRYTNNPGNVIDAPEDDPINEVKNSVILSDVQRVYLYGELSKKTQLTYFVVTYNRLEHKARVLAQKRAEIEDLKARIPPDTATIEDLIERADAYEAEYNFAVLVAEGSKAQLPDIVAREAQKRIDLAAKKIEFNAKIAENKGITVYNPDFVSNISGLPDTGLATLRDEIRTLELELLGYRLRQWQAEYADYQTYGATSAYEDIDEPTYTIDFTIESLDDSLYDMSDGNLPEALNLTYSNEVKSYLVDMSEAKPEVVLKGQFVSSFSSNTAINKSEKFPIVEWINKYLFSTIYYRRILAPINPLAPRVQNQWRSRYGVLMIDRLKSYTGFPYTSTENKVYDYEIEPPVPPTDDPNPAYTYSCELELIRNLPPDPNWIGGIYIADNENAVAVRETTVNYFKKDIKKTFLLSDFAGFFDSSAGIGLNEDKIYNGDQKVASISGDKPTIANLEYTIGDLRDRQTALDLVDLLNELRSEAIGDEAIFVEIGSAGRGVIEP
jgi:hypothetical protein